VTAVSAASPRKVGQNSKTGFSNLNEKPSKTATAEGRYTRPHNFFGRYIPNEALQSK
jgi:hypothetical protein